ncbi:hypothetical protein RUM43_005068, partial [Polyplax serrata]
MSKFVKSSGTRKKLEIPGRSSGSLGTGQNKVERKRKSLDEFYARTGARKWKMEGGECA